MKSRVVTLVACVAIATSLGCERPTPPVTDVRGTSDGGPDVGEPDVGELGDATLDVRELSDDDLDDRISRLRDVVIPPAGTTQSSVDRVYGEPRVQEKLTGKGSPANYPMHIYDLLLPEGRAEFRAFLYVTYRNDVVFRAGINHISVVKGRRAGPRTPAQKSALQNVLRRQKQRVLLDLEEIRKKYRVQLEKAAWER